MSSWQECDPRRSDVTCMGVPVAETAHQGVPLLHRPDQSWLVGLVPVEPILRAYYLAGPSLFVQALLSAFRIACPMQLKSPVEIT